jgi:hypothetical protein
VWSKIGGTMLLKSIILFAISYSAFADYTPLEADWSSNARIAPGENRANIYNLDPIKFEEMKTAGYIHAMKYPVAVTGLLIPYQPLLNFVNADSSDPLKKLILQLEKSISGMTSEKALYEWLGLNKINPESATGIYKMPLPNGKRDQFYAGAGLIKTSKGDGLTFSCFACHSANLFGTTVMGLTNKRVRANKFFHMARNLVPYIPNALFKVQTKATDQEVLQFDRTKKNLLSVAAVNPQVLGLDTSLPQVALSLARREDDEFASKNRYFEKNPRYNELEKFVADSKPLPWWNLKYKTRWLADGSIIEGNPIFTNILWNELGRGADLIELKNWMADNRKTIDELTVAAFATEAPRWTDFFSVTSIKIEKAKKGEVVFKNSCQKCHGEYQKAWSDVNSDKLSDSEKIVTTKIFYSDQTKVKDVGTDPQRYEGIKFFADNLNRLEISQWMKTYVEPQKGYVPPPLVGIWSRYPYLHNNSIPNLCALLTRPENRPKWFVQGPAENRETDFDQDCVGYPVGNKIPRHWLKDKEATYIANQKGKGMSNLGHSKAIVGENGEDLLTPEQKMDLIEFLKTL